MYIHMYTGAGKTSTFNMLTGDLRPTSGTALIADYDILTQLRKVRTGGILGVSVGVNAWVHVACVLLRYHLFIRIHIPICMYIVTYVRTYFMCIQFTHMHTKGMVYSSSDVPCAVCIRTPGAECSHVHCLVFNRCSNVSATVLNLMPCWRG